MIFELINCEGIRDCLWQIYNFLKRYFAGTVIKADLELVKDTGAAKEVETHTGAFRKADGC